MCVELNRGHSYNGCGELAARIGKLQMTMISDPDRPQRRDCRLQTAHAVRCLLGALAAVLLCVANSCQRGDETQEDPPPNIVLIVADDLGYGDIGANGSTVIATPHIDELAQQGVRLTDGYVSAAVCSPTRAGLFTGRYQSRFGYEYNPTANYASGPDAALGLPRDQGTLGNLMQDAGYVTGLIGKWHLGALEHYHPLNRGFDEFFGILGGGTSYIDSAKDGVYSWPRPTRGDRSSPLNAREVMDGFEVVEVEDYLTDVFAEKAVEFVDRHAGSPFFLALTPNAPHTPIQATAKYVDRYPGIEREGPRIYAAMVAALDDAVGQVVAALRRHDLERNTLVVFISDNGCINYVPDSICTNAPLAGAKRYQLEGGVRVPFLVKWPAGLPRGVVYQQPAISLDLYATFAAVAGMGPEQVDSPDSVDLLPYLRGERSDSPHEFLYWRSAPNVAIRSGKWKMWKVDKTDLKPADMQGARLLPAVDYPPDSPNGQLTVLYDLSADIGERENLAVSHPEIVRQLEAALDSWTSQLADPLWTSRRSSIDELEGQMVQLYF